MAFRSYLAIIVSVTLLIFISASLSLDPMNKASSLLTEPFLQWPTEDSIRVVWFTEYPDKNNRVIYGNHFTRVASAVTTKMGRMREDQRSKVESLPSTTINRDIWRHESLVSGLVTGERIPYQVISDRQINGKLEEIRSKQYTLTPKPRPGTASKILLTSDHQLMPMVAANLQKVVETIGQVDAVFFAGDLVNIADRASEWFDDNRGGAFFPCLQGRADYALNKSDKVTHYHGGEIIQYAPLFPAIGNHEVMGRYSKTQSLNQQFENSYPRIAAEKQYQEVAGQINPEANSEIANAWIKNHSFNSDSYEEIFSLPNTSPGNKRYYAVSFGDVRLVVLYVTNMWRSPQLDPKIKGRFQEPKADLSQPKKWGYGQHIFEPITPGSEQYSWLKEELQSQEFQQSKIKMVMFHHPPHTLGGNIVPPYTTPIAQQETSTERILTGIQYYYPPEQDYIIRDLLPLLESAGVQLIYFGHSHLWNRFISNNGTHYLESSNVGNSYGAHLESNPRPIPPNSPYAAFGDPNGLEPMMPTIAPVANGQGKPLPHVASNDITVFSILDTATASVSSYRFDTRKPDSEVIKFDQFFLN